MQRMKECDHNLNDDTTIFKIGFCKKYQDIIQLGKFATKKNSKGYDKVID